MTAITSRFQLQARVAILAVSFAAASCVAHVSLKNGNFFLPFKDVVFSQGLELKIERVYNSKTSYFGMFGWGWGCEYEVYLTSSPEGGVFVHEYGGGAKNPFSPELKGGKINIGQTVELIVSAACDAKDVISAKELDDLREKLLNDPDFRDKKYQAYLKAGLLPKRLSDPDVALVSNEYGHQWIKRIPHGFARFHDTGKTEYFDEDGRLQRITDKNGNFLRFVRDMRGRIKTISDNFNHRLGFVFNSDGLVEQITDESGRVASYHYNTLKEMVDSTDVGGDKYGYEYDAGGRHNLTKLLRGNETHTEISYYGTNLYENVKSVKEGDATTFYEYDYGKMNLGQTTVRTKTTAGTNEAALTSSSYAYFNATNAMGVAYTRRMVSVMNRETTDTEYNEFGLPERIIQRLGTAARTNTFRYDSDSRVIYKETPEGITELTYAAAVGKVASVKLTEKGNNGKIEWAKYEYDSLGNLAAASNSMNKAIQLRYDKGGQIISLSLQESERIDLAYNANGKPSEMGYYKGDKLIGKTSISYDNSGVVIDTKTDPPDADIAHKVTDAFQEMIEIIRLASVTLAP